MDVDWLHEYRVDALLHGIVRRARWIQADFFRSLFGDSRRVRAVPLDPSRFDELAAPELEDDPIARVALERVAGLPISQARRELIRRSRGGFHPLGG